jgi:hypothetical protein
MNPLQPLASQSATVNHGGAVPAPSSQNSTGGFALPAPLENIQKGVLHDRGLIAQIPREVPPLSSFEQKQVAQILSKGATISRPDAIRQVLLDRASTRIEKVQGKIPDTGQFTSISSPIHSHVLILGRRLMYAIGDLNLLNKLDGVSRTVTESERTTAEQLLSKARREVDAFMQKHLDLFAYPIDHF